MKQLTEEEFEKQFTPVPDAEGETVRPTDHGLDRESKHLWTIVDGDDGDLYALSGWHYVNRIGYLITEEAWTEETEAVWWFSANQDDEENDDTEASGN